MGQAFGQGEVALGQSRGDLADSRALLFGKLAQQFRIEFSVTRDP